MNKNNNYFFVHIPKTAGTSFRSALEDNDNIKMLYDYGKGVPESTDELVDKDFKNITYDNEIFDKDKYNFICGHVSYNKYGHCISDKHLVTILRNPVERVVSEFQHRQRGVHVYNSFIDYCSAPYERNKQYRMLKNIESIENALIGLTSHYNIFVDIFNEETNLNIQKISVNNAPESDKINRYSIPPHEIREAYEYNKMDLKFFFNCVHIFINSVKKYGLNTIPKDDAGWNCRIDYENKRIVGWVSKSINDCYFVLISVNHEKKVVIPIDQLRPDIFSLGLTEDLVCGFSYPLSLLGIFENDEVFLQIMGSKVHSRQFTYKVIS